MASVIHIAEVAAILTIAYVLGWAIGYLAHRLLARAPAIPAVPAERIAAVTAPAADALVKAPVIEPVPSGRPVPTPTPPPPAVEPVSAVEPLVVAEPEPVASFVPEALSEPDPAEPGLSPVAIPAIAAPPPMLVEPVPERAPPADPEPPRPEPEPPREPEIELTATPAMKPGEAWSGEIRGRAAAIQAAPVEELIVAEPSEPPPVEMPLTIDLGPVGPDSTYGEPLVPELEPELRSPEPLEAAPPPVASPPPAPPQLLDEDAAMRAIEGGWSRIRTRALSGAPELSDVGAAVAAAQSAVDQVLAQAGIDPESSRQSARPKGLPRPRNGRRDDLKRINGLGALDESTLNNLGVFHFDQIAGWSEAQVLWMENHVFARGRIGHESWQQQAKDLTGAVAG